MKKLCLLLALLLVFGTVSAALAEDVVIPEFTIGNKEIPENEGQAMVNAMRLGYNLGNAFDASECNWLKNELDYESAWCGAKTTEALIDALWEGGFRSIRIPISWHNHLADKENYIVSEAWMDRVQTVVDWALDRGFYVIINIHHDNSTKFLYPSNQYKDQTMKYFTSIWTQLADRFGDYGDHLLFESMNEMRLVDTQYEWYIDRNAPVVKEAIGIINEMNQTFVDLVRNSGKANNATRFLITPGYDASPEAVMNDMFVVPTDPNTENDHHIILGVHAYTPYNFALDYSGTSKWSIDSATDKSNLAGFMQNLYTKYVSQGQPVLLTEFGARNKDNVQARTEFVAYYVASARVRGITCFWWDNNATVGDGELFGIIDRKTCVWMFPTLMEAMDRYADGF